MKASPRSWTATLAPAAWFAAFAGLGLYRLQHHAMWRDELQDWLIVQASPTYSALLERIQYLGHPYLWPTALYLLTQLGFGVEAMQGLHLLIALGSAALILFASPLPLYQRVLAVFGYYLGFEYLVISRGYAPGIFFLLLAAFALAKKRGLVAALLFGLAAHCTAYTALVALALQFGALLDGLASPETAKRREAIFGTLCFTLLLLPAIVAMLPPADGYWQPQWGARFSLDALYERFLLTLDGLAPIPEWCTEFWYTHAVAVWRPWPELPLLALAALSLARSRRATLVFAVILLGVTAFQVLLYGKTLYRHLGLVFVGFLICRSLALTVWRDRGWAWAKRFLGRRESAATLLLLLPGSVGWLIALEATLEHPFSNAKAVAGYLREEGLAEYRILGEPDYAAFAVCGYLGRPLYDLFGVPRTYVSWDAGRRGHDGKLRPEVLRRLAAEGPVLVLLNRRLEETWLEPLQTFSGAVVPDENYVLYRLRPEKLPKSDEVWHGIDSEQQ